jgi:hypothetical protein
MLLLAIPLWGLLIYALGGSTALLIWTLVVGPIVATVLLVVLLKSRRHAAAREFAAAATCRRATATRASQPWS